MEPIIRKRNAYTHGLFWAAFEGNDALCRLLIEADADVNATNVGGRTPLMFATGNSHTRCVRALIEAGADTEAKGDEGTTALMHAIVTGTESCAIELIEAGVDVNAKNAYYFNALTLSAAYGRQECLRRLIEKGVDLEARTKRKDVTALYLACRRRKYQSIRLLLQKGAVIDSKIKEAMLDGKFEDDVKKIVRVYQRLRVWRDAVRVRPYALHWIDDYSRRVFGPGTPSSMHGCLLDEGNEAKARAIFLEERVRALEHALKRKVENGEEIVERAEKIARHRCGMEQTEG